MPRAAARASSFAAWAVLAAGLLYAHLLPVDLDSNAPARFLAQIRGEADKPYCLRPLAPFLTRTLASSVEPARVESFVLHSAPLTNFFLFKRWGIERATEYLSAFVVMYAGLVGTLLALRYFLGIFARPAAAQLGTLGAGLLLPALFADYAYLYDYPQLALFTLGLGLLAEARLGALALAFPLLCLSKETSVLIVLVYALHYRGRLPAGTYLRWLGALGGTWAAVRLAVQFAFRGNGGTSAEFHWTDYNEPYLRSVIEEGPSLRSVILLASVVALVLYGWTSKARFLRTSLLILVPLVSAALLAAYIDEWRDYAEVLGPLTALVLLSVPSARLPDSAGPNRVEVSA
jgi:hypothetical protein